MIQTSALRFKHFLKERQQLSLSGSEELLSVSEYYGVAPRSAVFSEERQESRAESLEGYRIVKKGDLVMNYMLAWKGAYGISSYDGIVSPAYSVFEVNQSIIDLRFLHHRTRSRDMQSTFKSVSKGIMESRLRLYPETLLSLPVEIPPLKYQSRVSEYLDKRTTRIDTLIAKKTRFIELLKEKRQAVITKAVTKGLDDSVVMKDSGAFWIGKTPAHWAVCKLSYRYSVELGKMLDEKKLTGLHPAPYLRNKDVQWEQINSSNLPFMDIFPNERERYTVRSGDLLVCEGGDVGRAAIWKGADNIIGFQKALHRLRSLSPDRDLAEFYFYSLFTAKKSGLFEESDTKSTISHLPAEKFREYRFSFPPFNEQVKIVAYLREVTGRIDTLIEKTERSIELLKEHRSALITAAVTGKIDVREAA